MITPIIPTEIADLQERAERARQIARVLRHDIVKNPPEDDGVLRRAVARVEQYENDAKRMLAEVIVRRGW